ncbi:MAG: DNA polymerase III subunit chi [Alphaproteobacteria bacterium]|jgi:DNA polymerase-3 subunit chi
MTEILFYHLERAGLEDVLPGLLEKTVERGWKALVCLSTPERLEALDSHLWTFRDESFLPHATDKDPRAASQPVLLGTDGRNRNDANVVFYADGAAPADWSAEALGTLERVVYLFDGRDAAATQAARDHWKEARATGFSTTYWQQSETGKWERKA